MFIVTRRPKEEIVLEENVRLKVLSTSSGRVKLRVLAPMPITVRRCAESEPDGLDCDPLLVQEADAAVR